jgi:hypothetical protein
VNRFQPTLRKVNTRLYHITTVSSPLQRQSGEPIQDSGFKPVSIEGIDQPIRMEAFGTLHEFDTPCTIVTSKEALAKM